MPTPPDVVLVMTDQQRHDQIGYASAGFFETPNLDRLAVSGVVFDNQSSDFVPTALDRAGRDPRPFGFDARSLAGLLGDPATPADEDRAVFCATTMGWPMVRRGPYKYILHRGTWSNALFHLDDDPDETRNRNEDAACRREWEELSRALNEELGRGVPNWEAATA